VEKEPNVTVEPGVGTLLVSIVDDDVSVRESLPALLAELGFAAQGFTSAEEFLAGGALTRTRCLLLDIALPGMSGPDLLRALARREPAIPIIIITGEHDEALRPRMLALGAVECLFKPLRVSALKKALRAAIGRGSP